MVMPSFLTEDRSSLKIGSCCFGVPIALHHTYFFLLLVLLIASARYTDAAFGLFMFLLYGPVLLITIVIHELGHILMTRRLGGEVGQIVLWPLGGFAICGPTNCGAWGDFRVAIAGPLTHIPQMVFWVGMYAAFSRGDFSDFSMSYYLVELSVSASDFFRILSQQAFWTNLFIFAFNLFVPAYPLDGGRALVSLLFLRGMRMEKIASIASWFSMVIGGGLLIFGLYSFIWLHSPNGIFMAIVSAYILQSSVLLYSMKRDGRLKEHPMFGRACYEEQEELESSSSMGVPKAEEAEMA